MKSTVDKDSDGRYDDVIVLSTHPSTRYKLYSFWKQPSRLTTNGWPIMARIFFSSFTCCTYGKQWYMHSLSSLWLSILVSTCTRMCRIIINLETVQLVRCQGLSRTGSLKAACCALSETPVVSSGCPSWIGSSLRRPCRCPCAAPAARGLQTTRPVALTLTMSLSCHSPRLDHDNAHS